MSDELLLALGAGMLAAVNPCGFALLPAYLSLLIVSGDDGAGRARAVGRALSSTAAMTLGFVAVFGVFGAVISPLAAGIQRYLPAVTIVVGFGLVLAGAWLLSGRSLPALGWSPAGPRLSRRFGVLVGFGASYAIASLTCTIAPFLAIVVTSFRSGTILRGVALYVAYGLGMGLLVGAAALAVALARTTVIDRLRRTGGLVPRLSGALLLVVGGYVAYYGWWELRVLAGDAASDPVIAAAAAVQAWLAGLVSTVGVVWIAVGAVALAAAGVLAGRLRRRTPTSR